MRRFYMAWFFLMIAGIFEIIWTIGLKYTEGFTKFIPSSITLIAMVLSFWCLSISLKSVPLSIAYAVWSGIGIVGTVVFGIMWFGESGSITKIICITLILAGILGLRVLDL